MLHFQIQSEKICGFAAEASKPGQKTISVLQKGTFYSDDPAFHMLMDQITKFLLAKGPFLIDFISKFLVILHENNTADVWVNDFPEMVGVKVNRSVEKGEVIHVQDIDDIVDVTFPDIPIAPQDALVYCTKIGWKFGLYFDFARNVDLDAVSKDIGTLVKKLRFEHSISSVTSDLRLIREDTSVLVITEGKTDWKHLKKAVEKLPIDLKMKFNEYEGDRGNVQLLSMCQHFATVENDKKMLFVFDRDNPNITKALEQETKTGTNYQIHGNNVFSFCLPVPSHREGYENISIEFYYTDKEVHTTDPETGRQLLFTNDVTEEGTKSLTTRKYEARVVKLDSPKKDEELKKKVYDKDADKITDKDGNLVAHSKSVFAGNVLNGKKAFDDFDFSQFKKIFDIIRNIAGRK